MSAARDLIRALEAGGMTQREIARRINRGPSYVSKVATGRKPGGGLEASLRALERGAGSAHAPRRRTAAGTPARVRQPAPRSETPARGRGSLAERIRAGARADGMGGTFDGGGGSGPVSWSVRAWRGSGGWKDLAAGDGGFTNPRSVEYVVLELPDGDGGTMLRQFSVFITDDHDFYDFVADVMSEYGVAE